METENIAIIIPAYKETKNIPLLLKNIFKTLPHVYVIIVDDSPSKEHAELEKIINKQKNKLFF